MPLSSAVNATGCRHSGIISHQKPSEIAFRNMSAVYLFGTVTGESGAVWIVSGNLFEYTLLPPIRVKLGNIGEEIGEYGRPGA